MSIGMNNNNRLLYTLRHLPYHLINARQPHLLCQLLIDPGTLLSPSMPDIQHVHATDRLGVEDAQVHAITGGPTGIVHDDEHLPGPLLRRKSGTDLFFSNLSISDQLPNKTE